MSSNPCKQLGLRVRQLRAKQGYTQEEFAERVGMYRTYMSRIESGSANPTLTMLYAMASGLGVPLVELFGPPEDGPSDDCPEASHTNNRRGGSRGRVKR